MRIKLIAIAVLLVSYTKLAAQEFKFSEFGEPSAEEFKLKQCPFDKDASAVILVDEAYSDYDDSYHLVTKHHVRIKILDQKGVDAANIKIKYWLKDDFENIYDVEGMTINTSEDGSISTIKLDKKSIFKQKKTDRIGEVTFTFPSIKAGSIIEYRYESVMRHYGGLDEWIFQNELPVMLSRFKLIIVPNTEFAYGVSKSPNIPIVIKSDKSAGSVYFEMQNIPGLGEEPFMDARRDYLQKVIFQLSSFSNGRSLDKKNYMNSWDDVIRELANDKNFGEQLNKNIPGTDDLIKQVKEMTAEKKMRTIYNFVRENMTWNNVYSIYAMDGLKTTWQKRQGTSGAINLLLVNLLKEAELEVYPVLVSERFHGKVNIDYPFLDQFNSVFACVNINEKKYFLDATDKFTPVQLIPYDILNTKALIVNKKKGGITDIINNELKYNDEILTNIEVSENGSFSGIVDVTSIDYARVKRLADYKDNENDFLKKYFRKDIDVTLRDFTLKNEENDSVPLEQHSAFNYTGGNDGAYDYIPLDLFSGFTENPFLAEGRFSNINFGYKRTIGLITTIHYPSNYVVDGLPKIMKIINEDRDIMISRQFVEDKDNRTITYNILIDFSNSLYTADTYPVIKEFYKKMFTMLKEPVLLKKK